MLWLRFAYSLLSASFMLACARPSVEDDVLGDEGIRGSNEAGVRGGDDDDDDDEDGDDPAPTAQRDAGGSDRDAGAPGRVLDAGSGPSAPCPDRDGDEVCDSDDNCSGSANTRQEDSDGDGIGDACDEVVLATCNGVPDPLEEELDLRLARVRTVRVNDSEGRASVKPGASVKVSAELTLVSISSCFPPQRPVSVGLFEGGDPDCENAVLCNTLFMPVTETVDFEIKAPEEPGWHYVGMSIGQAPIGQPTAGSCPGEAQFEVKIAALCVEP